MELLTKENAKSILARDDRRFALVPVEEWGCIVRVRSLAEDELFDYRQSVLTGAGKDREVNQRIMRVNLCATCIVDADGSPLWTAADLSKKSAHAIELVWTAATKLCGMDQDHIDDLLKNCDAAPEGGSY